MLLVLSQSPAAAQDGLQLLHKMQNALGGSERIAAIHDYEESVQAQTWNNERDSRYLVADGSTETRLEQWSAVQGIQFPHRLSMIKDGATVAVIRVNKIELDRGLECDELGEKPQDLKPVIAERIPTSNPGRPPVISDNSNR
jgi:hypothetical protein